jgi:imidazole glycerol phosphate synthase subunit HisF
MDIVASLYGRNNLSDIIRRAADQVYIPITVGGGIRSVDDAATSCAPAPTRSPSTRRRLPTRA